MQNKKLLDPNLTGQSAGQNCRTPGVSAATFAIGWRQVASCFLLLAADAFITSGYGVVAVPLGHEFHSTRTALMLAVTVMVAVSGLLFPLVGGLMDRLSLRRMILLGTVFLVAGYVGLSFTTSLIQAFIIFGLLLAPANVLIGPVATTVVLSRWFVTRRGIAMGIAISGISMGSIIYPPVLQWFLDHQDWRDGFRLFAAVLLCCTVPAAALVVNRPADRGLRPDGAAVDHTPSGSGGGAPHVSARVILADPTFWLAATVFATVMSAMSGTVTNLAPLAIDQGIKPHDAALLISVYGGGAFLGKLSFAAVADRINSRVLLFISLLGFATGMACLTQAAAGFWTIAVAVGLVGGFGGLMVPLQSFLVPRIFGPRVVGRAMGLVSVVVLCVSLFTPPLFGRIYDVTGSYTAIFVAFTALAVGVMLIVPYIRMHPRANEGTAAVLGEA